MTDMKAYSWPKKVLFVVADSGGVTPSKANGLLKKLREALTEFKFNNGMVIAGVSTVDEFRTEQKNPNLVLGSYLIRMEIYDKNTDGQSANRFNNDIFCLIGKALEEISFTHYKTILKIVENHSELGDLSVENARNYVPGFSELDRQKQAKNAKPKNL